MTGSQLYEVNTILYWRTTKAAKPACPAGLIGPFWRLDLVVMPPAPIKRTTEHACARRARDGVGLPDPAKLKSCDPLALRRARHTGAPDESSHRSNCCCLDRRFVFSTDARRSRYQDCEALQ